jgi:hypothetical protein
LDFFSWGKGIGDTFDVKNQGNTSKYPFLRWEFSLELSGENVGGTSIFCLVDWALVDSWINLLCKMELSGFAVDNWYN